MILLLLACRTCGRAADVPAVSRSTAPTPVASAPVAPAVSTGRFQLGINEAVSIPLRLRGAGPPDADAAAELADDAHLAVEAGASTVRGHTGNYPRSSWWMWERNPDVAQGETDLWVRSVEAAGLDPLLMLSPWPGNHTSDTTAEYVPASLDAYTAWVSKVVERYDGDGVDDMPGLARGVVWFEVDNEPDLKNTAQPRGGGGKVADPATFCTPDQYATVLIATAKGIRAASPAAKVLGGGFYRPHAPGTATYMDALFAIPGVHDAIDVLSVHTYSDDPDGERLAAGIRAVRQRVPDRPVWVTETSVTENGGQVEQARMVVTLAGRAAVEGAERLYWHTLADPPAQNRAGPGGFRTNSLFQTTEAGVRTGKPAAHTFRALATVLADHDLVGAVAEGTGAARLRDGSLLLWSGDHDAPHGGIDLSSGVPLTGGAIAPAWIAP